MAEVLVGVPTQGHRPLEALVARLAEQQTVHRVDVTLFVNLHKRHAEVEALAQRLHVSVIHVPEIGYSSVRNAMLDAAGGHDWLLMIDDDELPEVDWVERHLATAARFDADATTGPVHTVVENGPPWMDGGRLLRPRPDRATGIWSDHVASNNTGLARRLVESGLRFDPGFDGGGEDTDFFARARTHGFKVVWVADSVVVETADAQRADLRWVLHRAHSEGRRYGENCTRFGDSAPRLVPRKLAQLGRGSMRLLAGVLMGRPADWGRGLRDLAIAAGTLRGLATAARQESTFT